MASSSSSATSCPQSPPPWRCSARSPTIVAPQASPPRVRIGIHCAEATKVDGSYVGQGVHEAARVGSVAGPNEIVISGTSLAGAMVQGLGEPRLVELKGLAGTSVVHPIDWSAT